MTYPINQEHPHLYAKKVTLYAQLPDGVIQTRKTEHRYQFVTAVFTSDREGLPPTWGILAWHNTRYNAEKRMQAFRAHVPGAQWAIITVVETEPEPIPAQTLMDNVIADFMNAPAVEIVKPSLSFPEPVPGKTFKTARKGTTTVYIRLFVDGQHVSSFYHTKDLTARQSVKRFLGLGYALTDDDAKLVSPVSKYNGA